jgi:hypothetical protein
VLSTAVTEVTVPVLALKSLVPTLPLRASLKVTLKLMALLVVALAVASPGVRVAVFRVGSSESANGTANCLRSIRFNYSLIPY